VAAPGERRKDYPQFEVARFPAHSIVSQGSQEGASDGSPLEVPERFRRESVELVVTTEKTLGEVARDLGINYKTRQLVRSEHAKTAQGRPPGALSENERVEFKRQKKENAELKVEREILRKPAAYFAKEASQ
jgi:transposase